MQLEVLNSPFTQEQVQLLNQLLPQLTQSQQVWLNGYLSGLHTSGWQAGASVAVLEKPADLQQTSLEASQPLSKEVTVLYGSQTGNGQRIAKQLANALEDNGLVVTLSSMNEFKTNQLKTIQTLLIVVSTHGEGDPPDNGLSFHEFLHGRRAPKLELLEYAVLALGDSSYEFFCQTGKEFDERLAELGGKQLLPRIDCDLDFEEAAANWIQQLAEILKPSSGSRDAQHLTAPQQQIEVALPSTEPLYSRSHPYMAEVFENINLNGRGSNQETRHLELSLMDSGLTFEPGDAIGIYPTNDPVLVDAIIDKLGWQSEAFVPIGTKGEQAPLRQALLHHYEITVLTKPLLEKLAKLAKDAALHELVTSGHEQQLRDYIQGRDILDLVQDYPGWEGSATDFVTSLRKLPPRLYSIASSQAANPEEVHLTIRVVRYEAHGRERHGVCSVYCAERLQAGDHVPIFVQHNPNFKLPVDPATPIIMIGPGTGVAPFRSFIEERAETGAEGESWLFFGDQHFVTDFLYQTEWLRWLKEGALTRLDIAFSRDTEQKIYVQHRMLENSKALFEWLEKGAVVYVCGDEKRMAHDVHETLLQIIEREGGKSRDEAVQYVAQLQQEKRYQRDVY